MDSDFILKAIRRHHPRAAIVPEITIEDHDMPDRDQQVECEAFLSWPTVPDGWKYTRRIDALMFDGLIRTAIEIKVSRADFMRDTYWKRRAWQRVTHRFVYVVPHDLDVRAPGGCGLWRVEESGRVTVETKVTISKTPDALPQSVVQRLAYRAASARLDSESEC